MPEYTCYRCDDPIETPVEQHAYYVTASDIVTEETVEVAEAIVPNEATKGAIDTLQANHYPDTPVDRLTRAVVSGTELTDYLGVPAADPANAPEVRTENAKATTPAVADFDRVEVATVAEAPPETVKVERVVEQREVTKTGLVCPDCHDPEADTVIWGPEGGA